MYKRKLVVLSLYNVLEESVNCAFYSVLDKNVFYSEIEEDVF